MHIWKYRSYTCNGVLLRRKSMWFNVLLASCHVKRLTPKDWLNFCLSGTTTKKSLMSEILRFRLNKRATTSVLLVGYLNSQWFSSHKTYYYIYPRKVIRGEDDVPDFLLRFLICYWFVTCICKSETCCGWNKIQLLQGWHDSLVPWFPRFDMFNTWWPSNQGENMYARLGEYPSSVFPRYYLL